MSISQTTIKRLFVKSRNECAMPRCTSPLLIGDYIVGEICHIRARRKNGPRYDPNLSIIDRDEFANLILFCGTCHTLVDKNPKNYTIERLTDFKKRHEESGPCELTSEIAHQALLLFEKHVRANRDVLAKAAPAGIAVAVGGDNVGSINVNSRPRDRSNRYPANSIGADANMTNYVEYLCQLYVDYMQPTGIAVAELWARLGKSIKSRFRLRKRTRNHLSAERFSDLVNYLINEKIAGTPVGKKHLLRGTKLCRSFDEFRRAPMV